MLNKAIKSEKNEKGLYINRGDCFNKKNEKKYALLDYGKFKFILNYINFFIFKLFSLKKIEQANELDPEDDLIKKKIAEIYYEFGVEKYDEKNYEVLFYSN